MSNVKRGVCDICGFADDSYRLEESGSVLKVCKFCHDGYLERMGLSPDADKPIADVTMTLDLSAADEAETEDTKVEELSEEALQSVLKPDENDKQVLRRVNRRAREREKREETVMNAMNGEDVEGATPFMLAVARVKSVLNEALDGDDEETPLMRAIARTQAKKAAEVQTTELPEPQPAPTDSEEDGTAAAIAAAEQAGGMAVEPEPAQSADSKTEEPQPTSPANTEPQSAEPAPPVVTKAEEPAPPTEPEPEPPKNPEREPKPIEEKPTLVTEVDMTKKDKKKKKNDVDVLEQANPHIDDERIRITSPEVPLSLDSRPKTNLDVAIKEYRSGIKFLDAFKYVFHRVSYTVYLAVFVIAVAAALFVTRTWVEAVITLGAGVAAIALSFLLMWYLSYRYATDKRAYLLRIRQQEILFNSMKSDCYRELRTKFTVLKSLEWLLARLSVVLPLAVIVCATVAAVIVTFMFPAFYWLFDIILFGAIVAGLLVYWLVKFLADVVSYALDVERNQQIAQQTLLDILSQQNKKDD